MNKYLFVAAIAMSFLLSSCVDSEYSDFVDSQKGTTLENTNISSDFNWATSNTVAVKVIGISSTCPIKNTLSISADNAVYYSGNHSLNDTVLVKVVVPAAVSELALDMGTIHRTAKITNGAAVFTYVDSENN